MSPAGASGGRGGLGFEVIQGLGQGVPREGGALDPHGNLTTPCRASRSPSDTSGSPSPSAPSSARVVAASPSPGPSRRCSWIDIIDLNVRMVARVSARLLPLTAVDIIDADDWLIEQPCPVSLTSARRSPSSWTIEGDLVAAQGVESGLGVGGRGRQLPPVAGVAVVIEDDFSVEVFETGHRGRTCLR